MIDHRGHRGHGGGGQYVDASLKFVFRLAFLLMEISKFLLCICLCALCVLCGHFPKIAYFHHALIHVGGSCQILTFFPSLKSRDL